MPVRHPTQSSVPGTNRKAPEVDHLYAVGTSIFPFKLSLAVLATALSVGDHIIEG
ncbi:hypothetical protein [Estrella lausannensis]|uniref:hypothetical protein n=1 Tax=Estrella lausannensis TaxID=483423 RepID=UPI0013047A91|nr:hypothetical protein [Estrella lausannensis]